MVTVEKQIDEEQVRQQAYLFQIEDIRVLRQVHQQQLQRMIQIQEQMNEDFSAERQVFLRAARKHEQDERDLKARIAYLE